MQLVDKGFGVLQLFAVLLKIEIAILEMKTNAEMYEYDTTGLNKEIVNYFVERQTVVEFHANGIQVLHINKSTASVLT